jgi:hypothetical protein
MTSEVTQAASDTSQAESKPWAVYTLCGRDIEFAEPSLEQMMVLRRLARQLDDDAVPNNRKLVLMAKVLDAVSALMVREEDVDYSDQLVLERKVSLDELGPMIRTALSGSKAAQSKPQRRVRRR